MRRSAPLSGRSRSRRTWRARSCGLIEGARSVTGEVIYVDGGMHIAAPRCFRFTSLSARARPLRARQRLTGGPVDRVLLVEAGRVIQPLIHVPLGYGKLLPAHRTSTGPTNRSRSRRERAAHLHAARRVLGGSSSITAWSTSRPPRTTTTGAPGWDFNRCCLTSRNRRTRRAAQVNGTASAGRSRSATSSARAVRCFNRFGGLARLSRIRLQRRAPRKAGYYQRTPAADGAETATGYLRRRRSGPTHVEVNTLATRSSSMDVARPVFPLRQDLEAKREVVVAGGASIRRSSSSFRASVRGRSCSARGFR